MLRLDDVAVNSSSTLNMTLPAGHEVGDNSDGNCAQPPRMQLNVTLFRMNVMMQIVMRVKMRMKLILPTTSLSCRLNCTTYRYNTTTKGGSGSVTFLSNQSIGSLKVAGDLVGSRRVAGSRYV